MKNETTSWSENPRLDVSDEQVKSKLKSHEKRKLDACSIVVDELVLHDDWQYEGLAVDDVRGSSKHCDLLHENVVYNGHSLPNLDKERFANNVVLDDVVTNTLAYTLLLVLKKKCRNKVNVTRKTTCLNNSKTIRLRKGCGKRVAIGGHGRGMGRLIWLNVVAVDDDPHVTKQVSLPARSSNTECIPGAGDTYLPYNLSRVVAHTSRTADRHHYLPPVVTRSSIVMSADSAVTYTSVHSEARSWSIPSEDPYEEAAPLIRLFG
ncbi:hypothetical protein Tco_0499677 [Tanacetum coccineum]